MKQKQIFLIITILSSLLLAQGIVAGLNGNGYATHCDNDGDGFYNQITGSCEIGADYITDIAGMPPLPPGAPGGVPQTWDQNDGSYLEVYYDCGLGVFPAILQTGVGREPTTGGDFINTFTFGDEDFDFPYYYGCCSERYSCIDYLPPRSYVAPATMDQSANCVPPGTVQTFNGETIVCAPSNDGVEEGYNILGTWVDPDTSEAACLAVNPNYGWAHAGQKDEYGNYLGEYSIYQPLRNISEEPECCGDDTYESLVTESCDGGSHEPICCLNHGGPWREHNGECVREAECPDTQKAPPVFMPIDSKEGLYSIVEAELTRSGDGYCCIKGMDTTTKPLCELVDIGMGIRDGCFIEQSALPLIDTVPDLPHWGGTNPMHETFVRLGVEYATCIIDQDLAEVQSICADTKECTPEFSEVDITPPSYKKCTTYDIEYPEAKTYYPLPTGCNPNEVTGCTYETISYSPWVQMSSSCQVVCDTAKEALDGHSAVHPTQTCEMVCELEPQFTDVKVFRSMNCNFPLGCFPTGTVTVYDKPIITEASHCTANACTGDCSSGYYVREDANCELVLESSSNADCMHKPSCSGEDCTVRIPTYNVQHENYIARLTDNTEVYCHDLNNAIELESKHGDYWCPDPEIFSYNDDGYCEKHTDVCDQGFGYDLQNGCHSLTGNDPIWGLYNDKCVTASTIDPPPENLYDTACCFHTAFNGYNIFQDDPSITEINHVKVY